MYMNDIFLGLLNGIGVKSYIDFDFQFCNEVQTQGAFLTLTKKKDST